MTLKFTIIPKIHQLIIYQSCCPRSPLVKGEREAATTCCPLPAQPQLRRSPTVLATELRSQNRVSRPGSSELRDVVIQEGAEYLEWSSLEVTCWIRGQISGIPFRALFWPFFSLENILFPCFMAEIKIKIKSHGNPEWPLALGGWSLLGAREVGLPLYPLASGSGGLSSLRPLSESVTLTNMQPQSEV